MKKVISNLKAAMKNAGLFLIIQSILYILLAGLLIAAVIGVYQDGAALRAGDPLAAIFSREIAAKALRKIAPVFFGTVGITVAGLILGVKSEEETGEETGDGSVSPVSWGKRRHRTVPCLLPGAKKVRMVLLIAAIALIAAGVFNGSARDVFGKAVKICTECIGLG